MKTRPDIVMVLGAGITPGGAPSKSLVRRTRFGVKLALAQDVPLLVSGGLVHGPVTEASVMAQIAADHGVPADRIIVEDTSRNTWENFACALPMIAPDKSLWVVTDPSHSPRAWLMARRQGLRPRMVPAWWARPRSPWHRQARVWVREAAALMLFFLWPQRSRPLRLRSRK